MYRNELRVYVRDESVYLPPVAGNHGYVLKRSADTGNCVLSRGITDTVVYTRSSDGRRFTSLEGLFLGIFTFSATVATTGRRIRTAKSNKYGNENAGRFEPTAFTVFFFRVTRSSYIDRSTLTVSTTTYAFRLPRKAKCSHRRS